MNCCFLHWIDLINQFKLRNEKLCFFRPQQPIHSTHLFSLFNHSLIKFNCFILFDSFVCFFIEFDGGRANNPLLLEFIPSSIKKEEQLKRKEQINKPKHSVLALVLIAFFSWELIDGLLAFLLVFDWVEGPIQKTMKKEGSNPRSVLHSINWKSFIDWWSSKAGQVDDLPKGRGQQANFMNEIGGARSARQRRDEPTIHFINRGTRGPTHCRSWINEFKKIK